MTIPPPRPRRRRLLRALAIALAVPLVLWLLREPLFGGVVRRAAERRLQETLGGTWSVERIGGSWLGGVVVEGIAGDRAAAGRLESLRCGRLAIDWSLAGLLRGRGLDAVRRITAADVALALDLTLPGGGGGRGFDPALLPARLPDLVLEGSLALRTPAGPVRLDDVRLAGGGEALTLDTGAWSAPLVGAQPALAVRAVRSGTTVALGAPLPLAGIGIETLAWDAADGGWTARIGVGGGRIDAEGDPAQARLTLRGVDPAALPAWVPGRVDAWWPRGALDGDAHAQARPTGWQVAGGIQARALEVGALPPLALDLRGSWADGELALTALRFTGPGDSVVAAHDLRWRPGRNPPSSGVVSIACADARPWLALAGAPAPPGPIAITGGAEVAAGTIALRELRAHAAGWSLAVRGTAGITAALTLAARCEDPAALAWLAPALAEARGTLDITAQWRGLPMRWRHGRGSLTATGSGLGWRGVAGVDLDATAAWADGMLAVERLALRATAWEAEMAGSARPGPAPAIRLERLAGRVVDTPFALAAPVALRLGAEPALTPASLLLGDGRLTVSGSLGADALALDLVAERLPLTPLAALAGRDADGTLDATVHATGDPAAPTARLQLAVAGRLGTQAARLAIDARQDAEGLRLARAEVELPGLATARADGDWPLVVGRDGVRTRAVRGALALEAVLPDLRALPLGLEGGVTLRAQATTTDGAAHGTLAIAASRLRPRPAEDADGMPPVDATLEAELAGDGARAALAARLAGRDVLFGTVTSPGAVRRTALADPAVWRARALAGALTLEALPLAALAPLATVLTDAAGTASGDLRLAGTLGAPEAAGRLAIAHGEVRVKGLPRLTAVDGEATLAGREVRLALRAAMGEAPVAFHGTATLAGAETTIDLRATAEPAGSGDQGNALIARSRHLRVRADVDLRLHGRIDALHLAGRVQVVDALWSKPFDVWRASTPDADRQLQLFAIREGPFARMRLDVAVDTGGQPTVRLANNLMRADCRLDLHLGGTGAVPEPRGTLTTVDARLALPFSTLRVERAELRFPPGRPFDPELEATARTRAQGFDLTAQATGPLKDVEVTVTSTPPLPPDDALLLLTTGSTRTGLAEAGERGALTRVGTYVGQELLRKASGPGNPDEEGILDPFSLAIGQDTTRSGAETVVAEYILVEPLLRGELVLVGERDRWDDWNLGTLFRLRFR